MLTAIQGGEMATVECATKAHGRCKDVDCACRCHPAPRPTYTAQDIADAARAIELFGEDELEDFARRNRE